MQLLVMRQYDGVITLLRSGPAEMSTKIDKFQAKKSKAR
jgi:hypothetical protein